MRAITLSRWMMTSVLLSATACTAPASAPDEVEDESKLSVNPDATSLRPSDMSERFTTCPIQTEASSAQATFRGKSYTYKSDDEVRALEEGWEGRATIDQTALDGLTEPGGTATVIDIRRVGGVPKYGYFGSGSNMRKTFEPWSSAKFMAVSSAFAKAREVSGTKVGADGKVGAYAVADLATVVHNYGSSSNVTGGPSNEIAAYFLSVAGVERTNALIGSRWLHLSSDGSLFTPVPGRTRGPWGAEPFEVGGSKWTDAEGNSVSMPMGTMASDKNMSQLVQGEWLKRIAEKGRAPKYGMPGLQNEDVEIMFYGAKGRSSAGGMLSGVSNYVSSAIARLGPDANDTRGRIEAAAGKNWRIFHKVGWGDSTSRSRSEVMVVSYVCLPKWKGGREFVYVSRSSVPVSSVAQAGASAQAQANRVIEAVLGKP